MAKAIAPIEPTLSGIITDSRLGQSINAASPTLSSPWGSTAVESR